MGHLIPRALRVVQRAWIARAKPGSPRRRRPPDWGWPEHLLILDTETTTDPSQQLLFGSWRYGHFGLHGEFICDEEGLFYADDLESWNPEGLAVLQEYAKTHRAATRNRRRAALLLLSRREFVDTRLWKALDGGAMVVGYNLPFDLTRLAVEVGEPRNNLMYRGGFSLPVFEWVRNGIRKENQFRPRLLIKPLDSKRAVMGIGGRQKARPNEPEERKEGRHGRMLDLKQLVFALTDSHPSLARAAELFQLSVGKGRVEAHGVITEAYIRYNRQDVEVTAQLLEAVRAEWDRHPLALTADKVMSPASIGKGYLRALGVVPPRQQFTDVGAQVLGACMTAYYGGRAEVRVRRTAVPVVYLDFLSMYPTVNVLLGLWRMLTAERLKLVDATTQVRRLLAAMSLESCFDPRTWADLAFFTKIRPHGDILPVRAAYGPTPDNVTIGVNPLWSDEPLWVAGPDLVASVLFTGQVPEIVEAFRLVPVGEQAGLRPVALRNQVQIDPAREDFFKRLVEERQHARRRPDLAPAERSRLERFIKVVANSTSYGIFAELNPQPPDSDAAEAVEVYGSEGMFPSTTRAPEEPGEYCFPPFAALTTAAARLMLAMLERCVRDQGGEIAFGDTDSGAVVATKEGGLVPCHGGSEQLPDGSPAIRALSWAQVQAVVERFRSLSPYDREAVPDSILKIEKKNFEEASGQQRQLFTMAISAKRYVLFTQSADGTITIEEAKEHGLGHLLNPMNLEQENRDWIAEIWKYLIHEAVGRPEHLPSWVDRPAMTRVTVSTIGILRTFAPWNAEKSYAEGIKPMNFVLSPVIARFGHAMTPERFHLLGAYEPNPAKWLRMPWFDKYSGQQFRIGVGRGTPGDQVQVKSLRDVIEEYGVHPEPKSLDGSGKPCSQASRGLLSRRPVRLGSLAYAGKESNRLEEVQQGLLHSWKEAREIHLPPGLSAWDLIYLPAIRRVPIKRLASLTGKVPRLIRYWWKGLRRPKPATEKVLRSEAVRWALEVHTAADARAADFADVGQVVRSMSDIRFGGCRTAAGRWG